MRRNQPQQIPQNPQSQQIFKPVGKYWMIFAFVLIIDIAAVVLPLMSYLKISSLTQIEDHIYLQDGKMQIKDIIMLKEQDNKLEECPLGYHDLFKYTFHGLHPFYLCQQQIIPYVEEKVYVDEKEQCRFFADMDPVQFQVLKLGKDSIRICGKYMDRNIQLKKSCDENEIVCSFIKDQESYMCAYEVSDCPINQILLNENQGQDGKFQQSLKFIKQAPNSMPITDFDIVEGSVKCKQQNTTIFKDRKYHQIFKRQHKQSECQSDHMYLPLFEMYEPDFFAANDMNYLTEVNDFNISTKYIYTVLVFHQIPWKVKYQELYNVYLKWQKEGRFNQKDLQIFFCSFNLFIGVLIAATSFYSTQKNENIKIGFRCIQIAILWIIFFESILRYRITLKEILDHNNITHPQILTDVMITKQFYTQSIDFLDTSMISIVTTSIFLAVMQKWYYRKPSVANARVSIQQLQTFQPFFDDDQI